MSSKEMFVGGTTALASKSLGSDLLNGSNDLNQGAAAGVAYMKFNKAGQWVFGADNDVIEPDEVVAVDPSSFTIGWQGWNNGKPVNGPVKPIAERSTLAKESELDPLPAGDMNGWNLMLGVTMQTLSEGVPLQYNTTSYSGKKAMTQLMKEIGLGINEHEDAPVALVKLSGDNYKHKTYGIINTPVIEIVGWADVNGKEVEKLAV